VDGVHFCCSMTSEGKLGRRQRSYIYVPAWVERAALAGSVRGMGKREFLKAHCSLAYLYAGFHPDCWEDWGGPRRFGPLVNEAWRRAGAGVLTDNELYPYQASKARIVRERRAAGLERPM
jgi:hypothetical protein